MRLLVGALVAIQVTIPARVEPDAFQFFAPTIAVNQHDRESLVRGLPVVKLLEASGRELGAFTAVPVEPSVTVDRAAAWMRRIELLRENPYVISTQRFSTPPQPMDLDRLTLEEDDLEDLRDCVPGRCGVKLSIAEIRELTGTITAAGPHWKPAAQQAFRQIVMRRVLTFLARGHSGLDDHADHRRPVSPAVAFGRLLQDTAFLDEHAPDIKRRLAACASAPGAGGETFLYWSKERLGGRAVISVTHVTLTRENGTRAVPLVMTGVQVFATHYLDASLSVTAFARDSQSATGYFMYLQKSNVDLLGGFWGSVARSLIEGRVRKDGPKILGHVGARLASGEPPAGSTRHGWPLQ
jgi:hypothetical protein